MECIKCHAALPEGAIFCYICGRKQTVEKHRRSRGNGLGTVYKLSNGKWRAEKVIGWDIIPSADGTPPKKKKIVVTSSGYTTKKDALAALPGLTAETYAERRKRHSTEPKGRGDTITLKELYEAWEPTHKRSKSTMNCYAAGFKLFEPLWYSPMADIDVDDLQDCIDDAEQGKRTKENARACLGLVYKYGIPRNCIPKDRNLAQFLSISEEGGGKKSGLEADVVERIRKLAVNGDQTAVYVYCQCYLGFRPSELLDLRVEDYNAAEQAFTGGSKTAAGINRIVTVSPKILPFVEAQIRTSASGYVFEGNDARMDIKAYRAKFYALLDEIGVDNPVDENGRHKYTPHSCRHTFASFMKRVQGNDTDKLALIGHTSTNQLRDYQDVNYADLRALTDRL